ncbi:hypothetical protein V4B17_00615 [Bartonella sp. B23]
MRQQYILGKYTRVLIRKEGAIFSTGSKQFVINKKKDWENFAFFAARWIEKKVAEATYNLLSSIMLREDFSHAFNFLFSNHFLILAETSDNISNICIPEIISIIKVTVWIQSLFNTPFHKKCWSF